MLKLAIIAAGAITLLTACSPASNSQKNTKTMTQPDITRLAALSVSAPVADIQAHQSTHHGITISDPYHWLKDQGYPQIDDQPVIDYLTLENDYYQQFLAPHENLVNTLFEEFKGRVDETESSVPYIENGYEYRWEFAKGSNYRQYYRKNLTTGVETLFLDQQAMAQGFDYFVLGSWAVSPDNKLLAYVLDTDGDERYTLFVKDMTTGEMLSEKIEDVSRGLIFSADNAALMYHQLHKDRWNVKSLNYHVLGTSSAQDKVVYEELDDGFFMGAGLSASDEWVIISTGNSGAVEIHAVRRSNPLAEKITLISRDQKIIADADHSGEHFYLLANDTHVNSRFVKVHQDKVAYENWETLIAGSDEQYLQAFDVFKDKVVLQLSREGQDAITVLPNEGDTYDIEFPEALYSAGLDNNTSYTQSFVRLSYESMITPDTVYDYDFASKTLITRKQTTIPSGYDKTQYETYRLMAPARDGAMVPISIVYKKGFKKDGMHPMHLYGYGAYGAGMSPTFSTTRLSMLDRGFSFAIAHVRGGDEMGYQWYLDGKLEKRQNTFNDFIDVAEYLVQQGYVSKGNISASGRSAGGELMGAVTVQAPALWRSILLGVPFVDVLNTMLDASLPLTPPEWEEWGNPIEDKAAFELIQSYSPYDNIVANEYPPMMVTGGLNDPRVTYWEPAKWTAKMRATKTDDNLLVMRINMGAGHFANSGRYGRLKDYAEEMAFQLVAHGINE